ncbi:MAG: deoxyribonuclease IV [Chloroflexota bacterium]|nr:deoxyribonuclease IV [Chloroflexota bacterium]
MRIGAHVSSAGGISKAIGRGVEIGCETIQIFGSSPQSWTFTPINEIEIEAFRSLADENQIRPIFLHCIYLINLGSSNPDNLVKGIDSLINYMTLANQIDAEGIIFHPGSHKGSGFEAIFSQVTDSIKQVLDKSPEGPSLCLENMAGMGQHIGASFAELGEIVKSIDHPKLRICLDTQHSFAAGYDIRTPQGVANMMEEFESEIGIGKLAAVHANDSKQPLGSGIDRHENIGQGLIGESGFAALMSHSTLDNTPFLLEVPGFAGKGPDRSNIDILKTIRSRIDSLS